MSGATEGQLDLIEASAGHGHWCLMPDFRAALRALLDERAELLKALRPFADVWRRTPAHIRQWALTSGQSTLKVTVDDYARAAAALDAATPPKSEEKQK